VAFQTTLGVCSAHRQVNSCDQKVIGGRGTCFGLMAPAPWVWGQVQLLSARVLVQIVTEHDSNTKCRVSPRCRRVVGSKGSVGLVFSSEALCIIIAPTRPYPRLECVARNAPSAAHPDAG